MLLRRLNLAADQQHQSHGGATIGDINISTVYAAPQMHNVVDTSGDTGVGAVVRADLHFESGSGLRTGGGGGGGGGGVTLPGVAVGGAGTHPQQQPASRQLHVTDAMESVVASMALDHCVGRDLCLLGHKGEGKSAMVRVLGDRLGYRLELFSLYKDMTARDLFQRRATTEKGDTYWALSPLVLLVVRLF